jgi:hypothetical protein
MPEQLISLSLITISRCRLARPRIVPKLRAYPELPATSPELQNFTSILAAEADPTAPASAGDSDGAANLWIAEEAEDCPQDGGKQPERERPDCSGVAVAAVGGQLMEAYCTESTGGRRLAPAVGSGGVARCC